MAVSYSRNAGLALDADLALMLRRGAHRLASVLECKTTQARILMLKREPESCVSKNRMIIAFGRERNPRIMLLMKSAFKVGTRL